MSLRRCALTGMMAAAGVALLTGLPAGAADGINIRSGRIAGEGPAAAVAQGYLLRRIYLGDHGRMDEA